MFREDDDGLLRATPIAWSSEAHHRLPLAVVVDALEHHYPGRAVLSLETAGVREALRYRPRARPGHLGAGARAAAPGAADAKDAPEVSP
jgi:hypothetical protein